MNIIYAPHKDQINQRKHHISLAKAKRIEWETLYAMEDERYDYGEVRMIGCAFVGFNLYCVIYTDRDDTRRIISLRKANNREKRNYVYYY